jgi:hypothetical protein
LLLSEVSGDFCPAQRRGLLRRAGADFFRAGAATRTANIQPAVKDGKPVPVLLDLVVQFHIFSKRTAAASPPDSTEKPAEPALPGPFSVQHP